MSAGTTGPSAGPSTGPSTGPSATPFALAVAELRAAGRVAAPEPEPDPGSGPTADRARELAAQLVQDLTDRELLGVLDGDSGFVAGLRDFGRNGYNHAPIVAGEVPRLGIPGIRFTDGPRGIVMGRSTSFPVSMARGATWDPDLEREIGRAIGAEGRAQGANLFAGVCVNLLRHPAWGRAQETYGEDPVHLGRMGAALTSGVREHLMACVKHFALNSMENARFQVDVRVDDDVLHEVYLPHFREVVEAGADAVMSAYNKVNGQWCGDHPELLTTILRDQWGFDGFVMSDFLFGHRDPVGSVAAGLDLEMPFVQQRGAALPAALTDGSLRRSDASRAATRLVAAQLRWAATVSDPPPGTSVVASAPHRALARRAAAQSMVLLRNAPIGATSVLPISPGDVRSLAVIGALAERANLGDTGSSNVRPPDTVTPLDGLRAAFPDGTIDVHDGTDVDEAATVARTSDVAVVVVGYTAADEGESLLSMDRATMGLLPASRLLTRVGSSLISAITRFRSSSGGDRRALTLRPHDEELVAAVAAANPRTVVVVVAGSAVVMEAWRHQVAAILLAWYPGIEGGHALADVLTGEVEPGGRLPFAIPTDPMHLPHFDHDATTVRYDRWWGQRRLDRDQRQAAFPLGSGLGYTEISIERLTLTDVDTTGFTATARVAVRNHGHRPGSTVVQVYASGDTGPQRPGRQLLGFRRVTVGPCDHTEVDVELSLRPLTRRDTVSQQWSLVPRDVTVEASQFSGDPAASTTRLALAEG